MESQRVIMTGILKWFGKSRAEAEPRPWPPHLGGASDKGLVRSNNEDNFSIFPDWGLLVVADGMGGHNAGEVASKEAVSFVAEFFGRRKIDQMVKDPHKAKEFMVSCLVQANDAILAAGKLDDARQGMGTTAVLALLAGGLLHVAHVGDSRAYLHRQGNLNLLTDDHSLIFELIRSGQISPEDARSSPMRGRLTQALGGPYQVEPGYVQLEAEKGDWVLLCSDGLWDMLDDDAINEIMARHDQAQPICDELIRAANAAGGEDNITVVVGGII